MLNISFLKNSVICYECTGLTLFDSFTVNDFANRFNGTGAGQFFCKIVLLKTACKAVLRFAKRFNGKRGTAAFTIVKFLY